MKFLLCCLAVFAALLARAGELQDAAGRGDLDRVREMLVVAPGSINSRDRGTTALHEAARNNHLGVVQFLVSKGARLNEVDVHGSTPLRLAMGYGRKEVAAYLRAQGALEKLPTARPAVVPPVAPPAAPPVDPSAPPAVPVREPTVLAPPPLASILPGANAAIRPTNAPLVKPPSEHDMLPVIFPIHEAARIGDTQHIRFLCRNYPDLVDSTDEQGRTPLHVAAASSQFGAAEALVALRAKVAARTDSGMTPLHHAARVGDARIARLLIEHRADVNARDNYDTTPLLLATQSGEGGEFQAAEFSAGGQALRGVQDPAFRRAAVQAMHDKQYALVQLLVSNRAEVNVRNRSGATPLLQAVRLRNDAVVALLLRSGADPNAKDTTGGGTPLHVAAGRGMTNILALLLDARAVINAPDARGETPLAYALQSGRTNAADLLRARGGDIGPPQKFTANERDLVDFYRQSETVLSTGSPAEKMQLLLRLTPTRAEAEKMFPKHTAAAGRVVEQMAAEIRKTFSQPVKDSDAGREIWRVRTEPPGLLTQDWINRGWISREFPVISLVVDKAGSTSRPGDYCLVNKRWVLVPPLQAIAAAAQTPGR